MLVDKIILRDSGTSYFDDLLIFDKCVNVKEVKQAVKDFIEFNQEYSNEDIYKLIKNYFGNFTMIWLGDYEIVEY